MNVNQMKDFYLKVYWNAKQEDNDEIKKIEDNTENKNINKKIKRYEKVIQRKNIIEKFYINACKALAHFNKYYINKDFVDNYVRVRNVSYLNFKFYLFLKS